MNGKQVRELIQKHLGEAQGGVIDSNVSDLNRGQATARCYFLMKIDLVGSTAALRSASSATYLKLAHSYLSTVDRITQEHGAQPDQNEYAGDSVIAFFPEYGNDAVKTLRAACLSHYAARVLRGYDSQLAQLDLKTRTVLHFGELLVAMIGPHGESHRVAIGLPMHEMGHREKSPSVPVDGIYVTEQFASRLPQKVRSAFLRPVLLPGRDESPVARRPTPRLGEELVGFLATSRAPPAAPYPLTLATLLASPQPSTSRIGGLLHPSTLLQTASNEGTSATAKTPQERLADLLYKPNTVFSATQMTKPPRRDGFTVDMAAAYKDLGL